MVKPAAVRINRDAPAAPTAPDFQGLYAEHHAFVRRMLRGCGVPEEAADDALQDVFVIVHRRLADYDGARPFRGWLFGILRRVASEHARAARRRQRRLLGVDPPPPVAGPDRDLQAKQAAALMDAFLAGLSEAHREVFVLADLEGWTAPEIAEALRTRVGTVYSRLHHARARFEAALGAWRAGGRA